MRTEIISGQDPHGPWIALEILIGGGLVAFPTDTVYGLGTLAFNAKAVKKIYAAKERSPEKAIPVLLGEVKHLAKVSQAVPEMALKLAERFWPGPLTLIVPKHPRIPHAVSSTPTVGVRIPDHPVARALLVLSGPLAVTSANLSGQPAPSTAQEVLEQLGGRIAAILDGGRTPGGLASTVVDCTGVEPVILREGPVTLKQIRDALATKS
jgi:L-threonylcarbamoyladenylate synthase